jgi:outer membrane murein-binding lipoprotein Lpp
MSIYLSDGDEKQEQVASNLGWSQFGDWVETLDVKQHPAIVSLWEHGITEDVKSLTAQLEAAKQETSPSADVAGIIDGILSACAGAPMILITDGTQPEQSEGNDGTKSLTDEEIDAMTDDLGAADMEAAIAKRTPAMQALLRAKPE